MKKSILPQLPSPFSDKVVIAILLCLIIGLSFAAGWYHLQFTQERKKYLRLEDMFVRVRGELGREQTQQLIDQSYLDE